MIGVDIVEIGRIKRYAQKKYFLQKICTKKELEYCKGKPEHIATTFAAKEAVFKALGTGILEPKSVEIVRNKNGKPLVMLSKQLRKLIKNKKVELSLSFSDNYAVAFALVR
ncbi:holo-ACP synthase [Candidatus Woesearchaeota archaeon]|nr:holo-ACP synthase [Candidatus Woesearchaeota archaeon]